MIVFNKKNKGFTLIELLVVITIMVVLGIIFTNILIETLRGKNKVNAINQVKQNGQVVLDNLSNEIRDAEKIVCVGTYGSQDSEPKNTIVVFKNGTFSQFKFVKPTASKNGYIIKGNFTGTNILANVANSELCTADPPPENYNQYLTDIDPKNGVSIDALNGEDIFNQRGDSVIIKFSVSAGVQAGYAYDVTVQDGGVSFTTSVQTRGIKR